MEEKPNPPGGETPPPESSNPTPPAPSPPSPPPPPSYQPPASAPPPPPSYQPPASAPAPPPSFQPPASAPPPQQQFQAPVGGYSTGLSSKNPAISLLISFIVPGVGTIINGETGKGIAILVGYIVSLFLIIVLIGILLAPAVWIYGMYDAYQGAKKFNIAHGFPPGG
jgi:TM2 domain-containing membrane protein YozV